MVVSNIALLRRIKGYLPLYARRTFYMAFIQSYFDYCSIIWGKSPHTERLYNLQKRPISIILDIPARTPSQDLFMELRIMPIEDRFKFRILTAVIKALNECAPPPPYIINTFSIMSDQNRMSTGSCTLKDMQIPKVRLDLTKQGLRY